MLILDGANKDYEWGSPAAINEFRGAPAAATPLAETWFGTHPLGPTAVGYPTQPVGLAPAQGTLAQLIAANPQATLGPQIAQQFDNSLPFLVKFIAPAAPLSLQVHPTVRRARRGYWSEQRRRIPLTAPTRNYHDRNHKPEMVYALTEFFALSGFRTQRRVSEIFATFTTGLGARIAQALNRRRFETAIRQVLATLLTPSSRPDPGEIAQFVAHCRDRLAAGTSPSIRADQVVLDLFDRYPDDPGVVISLLLNPVSLRPGEVLYTPPGTPHAYLSGLGLEVMATSDNVLRMGLTPKHVDVKEALRNLHFKAVPPVRIAEETLVPGTHMYYVPISDFQLGILDVAAAPRWGGLGPRIIVSLSGQAEIRPEAGPALILKRGMVAFAPHSDGPLELSGVGQVAVISVP